ncbi:MAG TPA: CDP-alcohol phosphatidyltransferase family protein [Acidobacteriota bacterium]|nr:CDP-alcohol phosphatidyltransferase family protein [Acidobacteriota bacterium]
MTESNVKEGFREAGRTQESILARYEKRFLIAAAKRMPEPINSDHLTALGFIAMTLAGVSYWLARYNPYALLMVNVWLFFNWFGDSLDGTLARVRNRLRPRYGFYVDHILDAFGATFLMLGLAYSSYMTPSVAIGLLIVYLLFSIEIYLASYTIGEFKLSYFLFGPTEIRILLFIGNIVLLIHPYAILLGRTYKLFDVCGILGIIGMSITLLIATIRHIIQLYRKEPL